MPRYSSSRSSRSSSRSSRSGASYSSSSSSRHSSSGYGYGGYGGYGNSPRPQRSAPAPTPRPAPSNPQSGYFSAATGFFSGLLAARIFGGGGESDSGAPREPERLERNITLPEYTRDTESDCLYFTKLYSKCMFDSSHVTPCGKTCDDLREMLDTKCGGPL
jgi:hypothetical protein